MYLFKYIINKLDYVLNCIVDMPRFLLYEILSEHSVICSVIHFSSEL